MSPSPRLSGHARRPQLMGGRPWSFWVLRLCESSKETLMARRINQSSADTVALTEFVRPPPLADCWDDPKPACCGGNLSESARRAWRDAFET